MFTPNLDKALGLHQEITIIYVVDGFLAQFCNRDEVVAMGKSDTVKGALIALESAMYSYVNKK